MAQVYDLNQYNIFYITAQSKSFSKAAEKLNITQPAVSYSIKKLEESLNTKLFDRTSSGIKLTHAGKTLFYYVEKSHVSILSGIKVIKELNSGEINELNIGVPTHVGTYFFTTCISVFNKKYPNIKVNIVDKKTSEMIEMIQSKELDLLIDTDLAKMDDNNLVVKKIREFTGIFVAKKGVFPDYENKTLLSKEFAKLPIILPSQDTRTRKVIDSFFRRYNIALNPIIENNSSPIGKKLIEKGLGVGWMIDEFVKEELQTSEFVEIKPAVDQLKISLSIMYQQENLNSIIQDFIKILKNESN